MRKITVRLEDSDIKRIARICKAIKKTGQNPAMSTVVRRWIELGIKKFEEDFDLPTKPASNDSSDRPDMTETENRVLMAIKELVDESGGVSSPSMNEISKRCGFSHEWVHRTCFALRDKGYITFEENKHRDIKVLAS